MMEEEMQEIMDKTLGFWQEKKGLSLKDQLVLTKLIEKQLVEDLDNEDVEEDAEVDEYDEFDTDTEDEEDYTDDEEQGWEDDSEYIQEKEPRRNINVPRKEPQPATVSAKSYKVDEDVEKQILADLGSDEPKPSRDNMVPNSQPKPQPKPNPNKPMIVKKPIIQRRD